MQFATNSLECLFVLMILRLLLLPVAALLYMPCVYVCASLDCTEEDPDDPIETCCIEHCVPCLQRSRCFVVLHLMFTVPLFFVGGLILSSLMFPCYIVKFAYRRVVILWRLAKRIGVKWCGCGKKHH